MTPQSAVSEQARKCAIALWGDDQYEGDPDLEIIQRHMDLYATEREKELREALEWALNRGIGETNWTAVDFDKWDKCKALIRAEPLLQDTAMKGTKAEEER